MIKTRTFSFLALAAGAASAALVGCTANETQLNATLAPEPPANLVFADTTTPTRDYPQTVSTIQNGDTQGDGSIGFRYRSADNLSAWQYPLAEPGVFAANVVTLPYTLITERNDSHVSAGLQLPPSHTMMPPLPAEAAPIAPEAPAPAASEVPLPPIGEPSPAVIASTMPAVTEQAENRPDTILTATTDKPAAESFTIAGQVLRAGSYETRELTLSQVIVAAQPATEDTTKVRVQIDRAGEESAVTTLSELLSGKVEDVTVKSGDVITISVLP